MVIFVDGQTLSSSSEYVTLKQAASFLGVSPNTLRNWDRRGKLVAFRHPVNKYRLYRLEELARLLPHNRTESKGQIAETASEYLLKPQVERTVQGNGSIDRRFLRRTFSQMAKAFRDSSGGGAPIERFEEISKLFFCKMFAERTSRDSEWVQTAYSTDAEMHRYVSALYSEASDRYPAVLQGRYAEVSKDVHAVAESARLLAEIQLQHIGEDIKGGAYEELVRGSFDKGDHQQFFTPRIIVDFMIGLAEPKHGMVVCDPACGTGGFLIGVLNYLVGAGAEREARGSSRVEVIGAEIDQRMSWVAQMNLLMHGEEEPTVHLFPGAGSLSLDNKVDKALRRGEVDLILTNPPFGSDFSDPAWLTKYRLGKQSTSRRRGALFVERCLGLLRPGGRLCIVLDEGILNGPGNEDVREVMLKEAVVDAVVSLPEVAFMPYASVKASVVMLRRKNGHIGQEPVFMADPDHIGHRPNGDPLYGDAADENGQPVLLNDLPKVLQGWREYRLDRTRPVSDVLPTMFVTPSDRLRSKPAKTMNGSRLDTRYYHPSRDIADRALSRSPYPTPRLAELVVERQVSVIPAIEGADELWRYIGLANIESHTGKFYVSTLRGHSIKSTVRLFRGGDILFSKLRPELRKVVLVPDAEEDGYVSSESFVLRGLDRLRLGDELLPDLFSTERTRPQVDSTYLSYVLRSDVVFGQLVYQVTGVGRPRIDKMSLLNVRIPLPPLSVQRHLVRAFEQAMRRYANYQAQSRKALAEAQEVLRSGYDFIVKELCP